MSRNRNSVLIALVAVNVCFRTAAAFNGGLWRDEALFLDILSLPSWRDIVGVLNSSESHPPLFYAIMRLWGEVFGDSDTGYFVIPILLGGLTVPAAFAVGRSLFTQRAGLIAAVLVAFSPPLVEHGSTVRPYSLLTLLVMASSWCLFSALAHGGPRRWVAYAIASLASIYTHNWMWVVLAGQFCAGAVWFVRRPLSRARAWRGYLLAIAMIVIGYMPWFATLVSQSKNGGHSPLTAGTPQEWIQLFGFAVVSLVEATILPMPLNGRSVLLVSTLLAAVVLARPYAVSAHRAVRSKLQQHPAPVSTGVSPSYLLITAIAAFLMATMASTRSNLIPPQCLMILAPLLLLAIGAYFDQMLVGASEQPKQFAAVLAIGITLGGAYVAGQYDLATRPRSNAREIARLLSSHVEPGDLVIIIPGWLASSVNHYHPAETDQIEYPSQESQSVFGFSGLLSRFADPKAMELTLRRIESQAEHEGRVWLISDRDPVIPTAMIPASAGQRIIPSIEEVVLHEIDARLSDSYAVVRSSGTLLTQKARREELTAKLFSR